MKTLGIAVTLAFLAGCTSSARQNAALWGMVALTAAAASEIAEDAAAAEAAEDELYCDAYAPHATPCHASAHHHAAHHHAHPCEPGW